jgi:predicted amidophosphoribosyltransferase
MEDYFNYKGLCRVCKAELTTINAEVAPGMQIHVCEKCLESAKQNFIWICMHCGNVYIRPKILVLKRLAEPTIKYAYRQCADEQIIQGIDVCIECEPEAIMLYVEAAQNEQNNGHC